MESVLTSVVVTIISKCGCSLVLHTGLGKGEKVCSYTSRGATWDLDSRRQGPRLAAQGTSTRGAKGHSHQGSLVSPDNDSINISHLKGIANNSSCLIIDLSS